MRLSLILPTYKEAENLDALFSALAPSIRSGDEVIIVDDDSPDRTWEKAEQARTRFPWIRVLRRVGRRGLSSAVMEGFSIATGDVLAVMDADLQHDPAVIQKLVESIQQGNDVVVASRYRSGGSTGAWAADRKFLSRMGTSLALWLLPVRTTDPMSGFFAVRADVFRTHAERMHPRGFKILLELLSVLPTTASIAEIPLQFHARLHGESKMGLRVLWAFGLQLLIMAVRKGRRYAGLAFAVATVVLLYAWAPRSWALRNLLYSDVRSRATHAMERLRSEQGWPFSDMKLLVIDKNYMSIIHKTHMRGKDTQVCLSVQLSDFAISTCDKALL